MKHFGIFLQIAGVLAVIIGCADETPGHTIPLWWPLVWAAGGFAAMFTGYKLYRCGGGQSFFEE